MADTSRNDWPGTLTREDAIRLFDRATDRDDPFWEHLTDDFYDEATDTLPTIDQVFEALGVTGEEYAAACNRDR